MNLPRISEGNGNDAKYSNSHVNAGGHVSLIATGDQQNSDITAGNKLTLAADHDIQLLGGEHSRTNASISDARITLNDQAQQEQTGQSAEQTIASLDQSARSGQDNSNSLLKNWNGEELRQEVQAQAQITQAFGQQAAKAVGDYAGEQYQKALASGDAEGARNWAEGGAYRVAAHAAAGALGGGLGGALGAAASASLMPHIADAINQLDVPDAVKRAVATAAAAGLGAIAGSASGAASGLNVEVNNRQLHQSEYDLAKKNAKLVAQKLGISELEAEGRIIAEMLRNSDQQTAAAVGGIHDYQIRSVIGCQNLNCNGYKNDPQYANHDANSEWIAPNQEAYNVAQTQLDQGKTYSDLVAGNIKKDPVGATLAGAGMMGLGVVTGAGLPALGTAVAGAGIGSSVNGVGQMVVGQAFDWFSFVMAAATGAASSGMGLIPSILINTGGALTGSGVQGQNPNGAMAGAAAGTAMGFPIGSKIEGSLGNMMNPWYRQEWKDVGMGMSVWVPKSAAPSWAGNAASGAVQEVTGTKVQKTAEGKK